MIKLESKLIKVPKITSISHGKFLNNICIDK